MYYVLMLIHNLCTVLNNKLTTPFTPKHSKTSMYLRVKKLLQNTNSKEEDDSTDLHNWMYI